jgi:hypothetical protein
MKKFLQIAFLLLSAASFAQDKFIEVEVTDTISLKPLTFRCNVYLVNDDIYEMAVDSAAVAYEDNYDPKAEEEKEKNRLQEIKRKLEAKKYKVGPLGGSEEISKRSPYSVIGWNTIAGSENGWSVIVNSETDVKKIKDELKNDAKVEVTVLKYVDEVKAEEQLIKKLMDKAKARSVVIGACSGLKPGKIIEVRESRPTDAMSGLSELYGQIAKMGLLGQDTGNYAGSLSKTFVVRFSAE